jgi:hypothetical protein
MKLTSNERFEIQARAFEMMTGYTAPGKDCAPGASGHSYEERFGAWDVWKLAHKGCIDALLRSVELEFQDVTDSA